jgi:hypothetical protein
LLRSVHTHALAEEVAVSIALIGGHGFADARGAVLTETGAYTLSRLDGAGIHDDGGDLTQVA